MTISFATVVMLMAAGGAEPTAPAVPATNPGGWFTQNDYPSVSMAAEIEGVTRYQLTISPGGTVSDCVITSGSGSIDLDERTCSILLERGRFRPARDAKGKAVVGSFAGSVRWKLPKENTPPDPDELVYTFVIEADGTESGCRVEKAENMPADTAEHATRHCGQQQWLPYRDKKGNAIRRRVRVTMKTEVLDP